MEGRDFPSRSRDTSRTDTKGPQRDVSPDLGSSQVDPNDGCQNGTWNAGYATYGSANQILTVGDMPMYPGNATASLAETRTYNNMLQIRHLTSGVQGYHYPGTHAGSSVDNAIHLYNTGHNNGRVRKPSTTCWARR
jgi:hypothetical protein